MFRCSHLLSLVLVLTLCLCAAHGQQPHAALQSHEAFMTEIVGKKWETSFTSLPQLRFYADKIEVLAGDGSVSNTLVKVTHPEPGIIRVDYRSGDIQLFVFGDDLQSFVIASMKEMSSFSTGGAVRLPVAAGDAPVMVSFTDHPFWKDARLHAGKMEVLDGGGTAFATNPSFSYYPHVQGVVLPEKEVGAVVLSRQKPGTGWYLSGKNLGTGVRTDKAGFFRTFLTSKLTNYPLRSAHFNYALLRAGQEALARGQETYATRLVINTYGEASEQVTHCLHEMATLRRYCRSYPRGVELNAQALELAKKNQSSDKALLLNLGKELACSQADAGDFATSKKTLAEAYPLLPPPGGNISIPWMFYESLGITEFGLRNYAAAAQHFIDNAKRGREAKRPATEIESLLRLIPCQLAQNLPDLAEATLKQVLALQDQRAKDNPGVNYDTWRIAFACVALGKTQEAMKYSPVASQRQNWVSYEEYGRLVSVFNSGDKAAAQALARSFVGRFDNIQEINIRDDIDPITVKLTQAIADPTQTNVEMLEKVWLEQVESLRNRPLNNYLFARVMVATLAKLKSGR